VTVRTTRFRGALRQLAVLLACLGWMVCGTLSWSQITTASIAGTVSDTSQAVIPNVTVTATNAGTGVASTTTTDSSGRYAFLSLPIGTYSLSFARSGFQTSNISGVTLRVDQRITQNVTLRPGGGNQTVTVEATPALVDTTSASIGTVVGQAAILNMPLNLREVGALALLVPGTVNTTGISLATGAANGSGFNDIGYSGSGGGSGGNLLLIDGMISRALNNSSFALNPPPEMVH